MRLLSFAIGLLAAVVLMPEADALAWPWAQRLVIAGYGWENIATLRLIWQGLLMLLIFALVRAALTFLASASSLAFAMRLLSWRGGR